MGMEASFAQVTPQALDEFLKDPERAYEEVLPELSSILPPGLSEVEGFADQFEEQICQQLQAFQNLQDPAALKVKAEVEKMADRMLEQLKAPQSPGPGKFFTLHKDWHVLHYLLTGSGQVGSSPLEKAILGGTEFPIAADYGPLRYLMPEEVKDVAAALETVDPKNLLDKLNREDAESKRIYLARNMDDREAWEYLPEFFEEFRQFYQDAARNGNGMLLKIV